LPKIKFGGFIGGHDYGYQEDKRIYNPGWSSWLHHLKA